MPTPEQMKNLTGVYDETLRLVRDIDLERDSRYDLQSYALANLLAALTLLTKQLQLEVTNLGQRYDELERKVSQHADELSRLRNGSWA